MKVSFLQVFFTENRVRVYSQGFYVLAASLHLITFEFCLQNINYRFYLRRCFPCLQGHEA